MKSIALFFAVIALAILTVKFDDSSSSTQRVNDTVERLKFVAKTQGHQRAANSAANPEPFVFQ